MHRQWLNVMRIWSRQTSEDNHKAANLQLFDLCCELFVFEVLLQVMIPVHEQALKGRHITRVNNSIGHLRKYEAEAILHYAVDAFNI